MTPLNNAVTGSESAAVDFKMPAPGDSGYDEWRRSGKLPEFQEEPAEEKAEVKEVPQVQEHETGSSEEEESATSESVTAVSEPARPQKGKKSGEARKAELNTEIRELAKTAADLRKAIAEAKSAPRESQQEAQPAPDKEVKTAPEPQLDDKKPDGTAKYKSFAEYQKDWAGWVRGEAVREATAATTQHLSKTQLEQKTAESVAKVDAEWDKQLVKAREKYPNFDTTVKNFQTARDRNGNEFFMARGSAIDQFLLKSPQGADVFHYLAEHVNDEAVQRIFERTPDGKYFTMDAVQQILALGAIANQFVAKPKPVPSATIHSKAPNPPHQVSGSHATSVDEVEQAVKDGDQDAFTRLTNEKILESARSRNGRRRA